MKRMIALFLTTAVLLTLAACDLLSNKPEEIDWSDLLLGEHLPVPNTIMGDISHNDMNMLYVTIYPEDENEYVQYIDACIEMGYTIDADRSGGTYVAFSEKGFKVSIFSFSGEYQISLDAPEEMGEIEWPTIGIATRLPIPESTLGKVIWDNSDIYSVHIGNTTFDQYKTYLKACEDKGFVVGYTRGEKYYYAYDAEGYKLALEYLGYDRISIHITAPEKTEPNATTTPILTTKPTGVTVPNDTTNPKDSELVDGMRPEFKAAMDSYEAFFAEYCDFMKKYQQDPTNVELIGRYAEFMKQYVDTMEKMEAWDNGELNKEEVKYYIDVTARISKMLVDFVG